MSQINFNMPEGFLSFDSQCNYVGPVKYQHIAEALKYFGHLDEYLYVYVHPSDLNLFVMIKPKVFIIPGPSSKKKAWRIRTQNALKKEDIPALEISFSMLMPKETLLHYYEGNIIEIKLRDKPYAKKICQTRKNIFWKNIFTLGGITSLSKKDTNFDL